jgi:hypothetical protein
MSETPDTSITLSHKTVGLRQIFHTSAKAGILIAAGLFAFVPAMKALAKSTPDGPISPCSDPNYIQCESGSIPCSIPLGNYAIDVRYNDVCYCCASY